MTKCRICFKVIREGEFCLPCRERAIIRFMKGPEQSETIAPKKAPPAINVRGRETRQARVRELPLPEDREWGRFEDAQHSASRYNVADSLTGTASRGGRKSSPLAPKLWDAVLRSDGRKRESVTDAVIIRTYATAKVVENGTSAIDRAIALIRKIAWRAITETILGHKPGPLRLTYVPRIRKSQPTVPALPRVIRL